MYRGSPVATAFVAAAEFPNSSLLRSSAVRASRSPVLICPMNRAFRSTVKKPHDRVPRFLGHIVQNLHPRVLIALAQDAAHRRG